MAHIPHDVLFVVASFCNLSEVAVLLRTCKQWHLLDSNESFWQALYCNELTIDMNRQKLYLKEAEKPKEKKKYEGAIRQLKNLLGKHLVKYYDHSKQKTGEICNFKKTIQGYVHGRRFTLVRTEFDRLFAPIVENRKDRLPLWKKLVEVVAPLMKFQTHSEWLSKNWFDSETVWKEFHSSMAYKCQFPRDEEVILDLFHKVSKSLHVCIQPGLLKFPLNKNSDKIFKAVVSALKEDLEALYQLQRQALLFKQKMTPLLSNQILHLLFDHGYHLDANLWQIKMLMEENIFHPKYYKSYSSIEEMENDKETLADVSLKFHRGPTFLLLEVVQHPNLYTYFKKQLKYKFHLSDKKEYSFQIMDRILSSTYTNYKHQYVVVMDFLSEVKQIQNEENRNAQWQNLMNKMLFPVLCHMNYSSTRELFDDFITNFREYLKLGCDVNYYVIEKHHDQLTNLATYALRFPQPYLFDFLQFLVTETKFDVKHPVNGCVLATARILYSEPEAIEFLTQLGFTEGGDEETMNKLRENAEVSVI